MSDETKIKESLYDKTFTCPFCGKSFKNKAIKIRRNQLLTVDDDLYPHYSLIDPLLYDIIVCPHCDYSVLSKTFGPLLPKQKEWLRTQFSSSHKPHQYSEYTTIEEAILKHKMALLSCITIKSKVSEQAYLALHIAWLYRSNNDPVLEHSFLERAFDGFKEAFSVETFPILGIDQLTWTYLLAAIAFKIDRIEDSKFYLSKVFSDMDHSHRIKAHALTLKQKLFTSL